MAAQDGGCFSLPSEDSVAYTEFCLIFASNLAPTITQQQKRALFVEVAGRNILYRYTIEYADRHREALNAVKTIPELQALLDGDRGLVEDFIRYAARQGVAPNYRDIARSRKLIEAQLRAYIGRNTALEDNGFYANIYPVDNVIVRAVGILNETREND